MKNLKVLTCIILIIFALIQFAKSQTENTFTTYTGGFSINLPQKTISAGGNMTAGGVKFLWRQPEVEYEVGFYEIEGLPLSQINGEFSFDETVKKYFNKFSARGEKIYDKDITLQGNKGREYKYKTAESVFILRLFSAGDRIYKIQAQIPLKDQSQESKVLQVFDSFRLLDEKSVKEFMAKKLADATPKEFPQTPVIAKLKTDTEDRNLKGKVKSVLTEYAIFGLNSTMRKKHPSQYEEFNQNGGILKQTDFDSYGNPNKIAAFGYIAGKRVSTEGRISYDYDFVGGIRLESSSQTIKTAKPDNRYQTSFGYKYTGNKLIEEKVLSNDGTLIERKTHKYLKGKKETLNYGGDTQPYSKTVSTLDEKGNETEIILYYSDGSKLVADKRFTIKYDSFDEKGNWTQRTILELLEFGEIKNLSPSSIEYRTINYYE